MPVEEVLTPHAELLSRTKLCYGMDRLGFERDLLEPIQRLACFVNMLPATADNFFCEPGGLLRLSLETAFFALQGTDGHIVAGRATISARRELEPRWRQATYLAGLCCELHRTLGHIVVIDERGTEWPAYISPLTTWLVQQGSQRFFIRWLERAQGSRALGLFALPHILPAHTLQHLASGNSVVVPQMLACVGGIAVHPGQNVLADLVDRAGALVIDRDLVASAARKGRSILGAHLERYLLNAMRRLVATNVSWSPNAERSRVWYGSDGLFVVWPNAATDICKLLDAEALPGIPRAPATMVDILLSAGTVVRRAPDQPLWTIMPPGSRGPLEALKIAAPSMLLSDSFDTAKPLDTALLVVANAPSPTTQSQRAEPPDRNTPEEGPIVSAELFSSADLAPAAAELRAQPDLFHRDPDNDEGATGPQGFDAMAAPTFSLDAPLRLNPRVRGVLAGAVATLNGDTEAARVVRMPSGVFVPLAVFKQGQLDVTMAVRSLAELAMIATSSKGVARTVKQELDGSEEVGVVLLPRFVRGLNPAEPAVAR